MKTFERRVNDNMSMGVQVQPTDLITYALTPYKCTDFICDIAFTQQVILKMMHEWWLIYSIP